MTWYNVTDCTSSFTALASSPDMEPPIACHLYDYIEIACMYGYEVELELDDGTHRRGNAITTRVFEQMEFLLIQSDGKQMSIPLTRLKCMKALSPNPHFDTVNF